MAQEDHTDQNGSAGEAEADRKARVAEIATLFDEICALVSRTIDEERPVTARTTRKVLDKLGELQTAHLMVLQAQEKFHDKFAEDDDSSGLDYEAIRRDIGRALDRIRAASGADDISARPDT